MCGCGCWGVGVCVRVEYMCMLPRIFIPSHTCTAMVRLVAWNSFWMIGAILCAQRNKSDTSSGVRSANRATTRLVEMRMSARMLRTSSCQTLISNVNNSMYTSLRRSKLRWKTMGWNRVKGPAEDRAKFQACLPFSLIRRDR